MFFDSTSWGVFVWFMVMVIGLWAWSIKYKKTNGRKEGAWWNWLIISFVALIHFTKLRLGPLAWEYGHEPSGFSLIGWWISLLTVSGLLLYKWLHEEDIEALRQENKRLREAVEYFRNKQENDN